MSHYGVKARSVKLTAYNGFPWREFVCSCDLYRKKILFFYFYFFQFSCGFTHDSACSGVHILFCMHSFCGVLPSGGSYRFVDIVVFFIVSFGPTSFLFSFFVPLFVFFFFFCEWLSGLGSFVLNFFVSFLLVAEKLWTGLENFVFDWLINADRCGFYETLSLSLSL